MFNGKSILITGGTGSLGKKLVEILRTKFKPSKIIIYSRDELKQFEMSQRWTDSGDSPMRYFLGDVRDFSRLKMAMEGIDYVIHAAALKQVPAAEYNPFEFVKTNIIGAQNVIDACMQTGVKKVLAISTDKAAAPINLYGATKLTSDKLFVAANNYKGSRDMAFSVVRYGNVMGSRGSVIPFFLRKKELGEILPITDKRMTRFNITLKESAEFVLSCMANMEGGELFVPKLPSYNITDLVMAIAPKNQLDYVGIRPGEKLHEEMITQTDAMRTMELDKYFVIFPSTECNELIEKTRAKSLKSKMLSYGFSYNSGNNTEFLKVDELKFLIENRMNE